MCPQVVVTHVAGSSLVGREQKIGTATVRFGRHPDNEVAFDPKDDIAVSSFHAELTHRDGSWYLTDLDSRNGTFVNDRRITGSQPIPDGARIRFGEAGPQVIVGFSADSADNIRAFVGQNTMVQAIDQVIERERLHSRKRLTLLVGMGAAATVLLGLTLWWGQRDLVGEQEEIASRVVQTKVALEESPTIVDQELAPITERITKLRREHAAAEADLERLTVGISKQKQLVSEIQSRADLTEPMRQQMLQEANVKLQELMQRLDRTQTVLRSTSREPDWPAILEPYLQAVFLCYYDSGSTFGIGTAFALDPDGLLVTNAHVAEAMVKKKLQLIIENETGRIFVVQEVRIHPKYDRTAGCPDLALIRVDTRGSQLTTVQLAEESDLKNLKIGSHLGTLGFPGELLYDYSRGINLREMRSTKALATFKDGWVGQITDFQLKPAQFPQAVFIQHSASVSHGTSGSPLFNTQGKVVAVNNSGRDIEFLGDHDDENGEKIARSAHPAEISRAIRIDVLEEFRKQIGW